MENYHPLVSLYNISVSPFRQYDKTLGCPSVSGKKPHPGEDLGYSLTDPVVYLIAFILLYVFTLELYTLHRSMWESRFRGARNNSIHFCQLQLGATHGLLTGLEYHILLQKLGRFLSYVPFLHICLKNLSGIGK